MKGNLVTDGVTGRVYEKGYLEGMNASIAIFKEYHDQLSEESINHIYRLIGEQSLAGDFPDRESIKLMVEKEK